MVEVQVEVEVQHLQEEAHPPEGPAEAVERPEGGGGGGGVEEEGGEEGDKHPHPLHPPPHQEGARLLLHLVEPPVLAPGHVA